MRDSHTITITDYRGARHYSLSRFVRRLALAAVAGLGAVLLAGAATIYWLNHQIDALEVRRDGLQADFARLDAERTNLLDAVKRKNTELVSASRELATVNDQLGDIEIMVGLRDRPESETDMRARLDHTRQTVRERVSMLQQIPSGYPVEAHGVTSPFGWRTHPITGERAFHNGIDLRASRGTPVRATADGVVEWAAFHKRSGLGRLIIIRHNFGFRTYFGHLHDVGVSPGDFVQRGELLGHVGSTGLSSGPHLHYEVRQIYRKFDPRPFMAWSLDNYDSLFAQEDGVKWDSLAKAVKRRLNSEGEPRLSLRGAVSTGN